MSICTGPGCWPHFFSSTGTPIATARRCGRCSSIWHFLIVLLHEFGHALACRSVGGTAERIILWPLGGVAYVNPPPRPGPMLWSIAAGPLVNVALVPVLILAGVLVNVRGGGATDLAEFVRQVAWINGGLLIFNLFPAYPLDGRRAFVWSILWFFMGRWHSLLVSTILGLICAAAAVALAVKVGDQWLVYVALYAAFLSWNGFQQARRMVKLNAGPKYQDYACPSCHAHPPMAALWRCSCGAAYDTFATAGRCPGCQASSSTTQCSSCGSRASVGPVVRAGIPGERKRRRGAAAAAGVPGVTAGRSGTALRSAALTANAGMG